MAQPPVTLRSVKGAPLTWQEGDENFSNLAAAALPTGGATGQILAKSGSSDYAVSFVDASTLQGVTGFTGSQGIQGFTGSQGVGFTGSQGDQGIQGFTGSQGAIGFTGSAGTGGGGALNDLTDVTITTATTNDVLLYNGTGWVNSDILGDIEAALIAING